MNETQKPKHAIHIVEQKTVEGFRNVIVIGRDETLHEIANGIMHQKNISPSSISPRLIATFKN